MFPPRDRRCRLLLVPLFIGTITRRALNVAGLLLFGRLTDTLYVILSHPADEKRSTLDHFPLSLFLAWLTTKFLNGRNCGVPALVGYLLDRIERRMSLHLECAAYQRVMTLSMPYHDSKETGEIIKAVEEAHGLTKLCETLVLDIIPIFIDIAIAVWYIQYLLDVWSIGIIIGIGCTYLSAAYLEFVFTRTLRRSWVTAYRRTSSLVNEIIGNWTTVAHFNQFEHERRRWLQVLQVTNSIGQKSSDRTTTIAAAQDLCENIGQAVLSFRSVWLVLRGQSPIGNFVALQMYWTNIMAPLSTLWKVFRNLQSTLSLRSVF